MQLILEANNLRACYSDGTSPLRGASLAIAPGERVAILGKSGVGKSTLLRTLVGLEPFAEGIVKYKGQTVLGANSNTIEPHLLRREIMLVLQSPSLLPHLTGRQNIAIAMKAVRGAKKIEIERMINILSQELSIDYVLDRYPSQMSGGELQRMQLARALALEPPVLLLDEVTANLDSTTSRSIVRELRSSSRVLHGEQTILFVTHDLEFASELATRTLYLEDGLVTA